MKIALVCVTLLLIGISSVQSQCLAHICAAQATAGGLTNYPGPMVGQGQIGNVGPFQQPRKKRQVSGYEAPPTYETPSYNESPPSYEAPTEPPKVLNPGRVIVMPPPGKAPSGYPQPGQPGGGALPETDPYIAAMAPDGTVPIAIFPPFGKRPLFPTKCVVYSELTDFEDLEINDYGNIRLDQENTYSAPTPPPATSYNIYSPPDLSYNNTQTSPQSFQTSYNPQFPVVNTTHSYFRLGRRDIDSNYNNKRVIRQSYYAPPPTTTTTEAPPRVVYRTYGYTCQIIVSIDVCFIGTECDENGKDLRSKNRFASYGKSRNQYQSRKGPSHMGLSTPDCVYTQEQNDACLNWRETRNQYEGFGGPTGFGNSGFGNPGFGNFGFGRR